MKLSLLVMCMYELFVKVCGLMKSLLSMFEGTGLHMHISLID